LARGVRGKRDKTQADIVLAWLLDDLLVRDVARLLETSESSIIRWRQRGVPEKLADKIVARYGEKTARDTIDSAMADAQYCTQVGLGGNPYMRIHSNKDGSLDAQLTVFDLPRRMTVIKALSQFGECARALVNTFNTWIQVGLRWVTVRGKVPDSGDRRYRGLAEGSTFYYPSEDLGRAFRFAIDMAKNVKKRRRKVETMFIRLHWNPAGVPPKDWGSKPAYRAYKRKG
jgi:hypothetical protein